jgi:hypothetical protein
MNPGILSGLPAQAAKGGPKRRGDACFTGAVAGRPERVSALDFTKGVLVVFMIVYHSINFIHNDPEWTKYLRFVPPSFILITGFLITNVYLVKYDLRSHQVGKRLLVRGFKLFMIFAVLNVASNLLLTRTWDGNRFETGSLPDRVGDVFLWGTGKQAFCQVLLPISYLLVLSAGLLAVFRWQKALFQAALNGLLLATVILAGAGYAGTNFILLSLGIWGLGFGLMPLAQIDRVARHFYTILAVYLLYIGLSVIVQLHDLVQDVGDCLALLLIYAAGLRFGGSGLLQKQLILLGKYSLFAYVAQVGLLRLIRHPLVEITFPPAGVFAGFAITLALLMLMVLVLDKARSKVPTVDRMYKAVFA